MKRIPQGRDSKEYREEAVKLAVDQRLRIPEGSKRLDVPKSSVNKGVRASKARKFGNIGSN